MTSRLSDMQANKCDCEKLIFKRKKNYVNPFFINVRIIEHLDAAKWLETKAT
jgi:hypothetical protein